MAKNKKMTTHRCKRTIIAGLFVIITGVLAYVILTRPYITIDTHEQIGSIEEARLLVAANKNTGIDKTILVPSPIETLTLNGKKSFTGYRENTQLLFDITREFPDRFIPFCTVSPLDTDSLEYLQECVKQGGKGLKLYNGHSYYHDIFNLPLDNARMHAIYSFAEREHLPVSFHVNITKYEDELELLLDAHPDLVISIPHYMVSSIDLDRVSKLMSEHPNLYTDISFGSQEFMAAGFRRINKNPGKYADFINNFADRILFGADMVMTNPEGKSQAFIEEVSRCYMNLLSERRFYCGPVANYYEGQMRQYQKDYEECEPKKGDYCESLKIKAAVYEARYNEVVKLNGLGLSSTVLEKIYSKNPSRFLSASY